MGDWEPRRCARITPERSLMVFAGRGTPDLAARVAEKLGIELGHVDIRTFADGHTEIIPMATPLPAAFWLLGSGLMGLVGIRRRMTAA